MRLWIDLHEVVWFGIRSLCGREELGFRKGVARIAGANGVAQVLAFSASPVLTRLFSPADFGLYGMFLAVVGPASVLATLRFEDAVPLPRADIKASVLVAVGCAVAVGSGLVAAALTFLMFDHQLGTSPSFYIPALAGIAVIGSGVSASLISWAVRERAYSTIARATLTKSFCQTLGHIAMGFAGLGAAGLAGGKALEKTMGIAAVGRLYWQTGRKRLQRTTARQMLHVARAYSRFPAYGVPGQAFTSGSQFLPPLILAAAYGPQSAGMFVLALRVLVTPLMTLGGAIGQAYVGVAPDLFRSAPTRLLKLFDRVGMLLFFSGAALVGVLMIGGEALFGLVFGDQWTNGAITVRLIGFAMAAKVTSGALSRTLHVVNRLSTKLWFDAAAFLLGVGGLAVAAASGAGEQFALGLYGGLLLLHHALYVYFLRRVLQRAANEQRAQTHLPGIDSAN